MWGIDGSFCEAWYRYCSGFIIDLDHLTNEKPAEDDANMGIIGGVECEKGSMRGRVKAQGRETTFGFLLSSIVLALHVQSFLQ
ncbi:hypothetical protein Cni_G28558 [Canna indica]|uniref:Uncharacterized protein n=1 Tax=Canna indica TaxID=4628 RepID=A0AAQ3QSF9_9LILI|nr:hypothetical protein Cni_G28558 [Canna indica]